MAARLLWRSKKLGTFNSPKAYELRQGNVTVAIAQEQNGLWFSYGLGPCAWNTCKDLDTLENVKFDAMRRAKEALKGGDV